MSGRKKDGIWQHFVEITNKFKGKTGCRAMCKLCEKEMQGLVQRLKQHREKCLQRRSMVNENSSDTDTEIVTKSPTQNSSKQSSSVEFLEEPQPSTSKAATELNLSFTKKRKVMPDTKSSSGNSGNKDMMASFLVRTSKDQKHEIDKQIAKAVYATNSSFRCIEHPQVKKVIQMLRPPSRFCLSSTLLSEIYEQEKTVCFGELSNTSVCMSLDGWSNIHNEPVICATITTENGSTFLFETIDTSGNAHTSEYLTDLATTLINKCKTAYNCTVTSFVTDNAANMHRMRENIKEKTDFPVNVLTYGCSAHILNLLSKDLEIKNIKEHIVHVVKYFRNNHLASAKYKAEGGKALVMPQDVRWNTLADCLEVYVSEWQKLLKICEENRNEIDTIVSEKVSNIQIKRLAEDFLAILKPISIALDRVKKNAFLSDAVEVWKELESTFDKDDNISIIQIRIFKKRYNQAMTPYHYLAYLLDPRKTKYSLTVEEKESALQAAEEIYPDSGLLPIVIKLEARSRPFTKVMFSENILKNVTAVEWWKSQKNISDITTILPIVQQLLGSVASSASVERVFSSFGLVHSNLRNRLGIEKAGKLVFLFKYYNDNNE
jgi:transcription termination factor NusB